MKNYALITRGEEDAQILADDLKNLGYEPLICPILNFIYLDCTEFFGKISNLNLVMLASSPRAIKSIAKSTIKRDYQIFVVGKGTEDAAINEGFTNVTASIGGVNELQKLFIEKIKASDDKRIFYISGDVVTLDLAEELLQCGYDAMRIEVYRTSYADKIIDEVLYKLLNEKVGIATFFSENTAHRFVKLINSLTQKVDFTQTTAFSISDKISRKLAVLNWQNIVTSTNPNKNSLIEAVIERDQKK